MASEVRTRRATATSEFDAFNLSNVERLVFAQAVHEFGSDAWPEVAKLLSKHPLISQSKGAITAQSCSALYQRLMEDAGLEWSEAGAGPRSEKHLRLAQRYYVARVTELRELIASEEVQFKKLVAEIDEIRSGAWDDKLMPSIVAKTRDPLDPPSATQEGESICDTRTERQGQQQEQQQEKQQEQPKQSVEPQAAIIVESPPVPEPEEKEEGSDNEAVIELIGNFESERPAVEAQDDIELAILNVIDHRSAAEFQEDEMQVDEAPVKQEQEEDDLSYAQPVVSLTEANLQVESEVTVNEAEVQEQKAEETQEAQNSVQEEQAEVQETQTEFQEGQGQVQEMHIDAQEEQAEVEEQEAHTEPTPPTHSEGKRKASEADTVMLDAHRDKKRSREESEPADEEDGLPKTRRRERTGGSDKRFQNMIGMLHSQISQHRYGNIFHNPIKKSEAPDYHDIVKRPMDLKTIKSRVKDGLISNSLEFQRDIFLMFANSMMYNRPGSEIYNMAEEMMVSSEREINAFRQTEGFHRM